MKRNFIIYIVIGLFTGFILGHFARKSHLTSNSPQTETKEQSVQEDRANRKSQPQTQTQKIATLTTRIENLQRRLDATRLKAKRYDKVRELWKQEGFGAGISPDLVTDGLMPNAALIEFFGWDISTVDEIAWIAKAAVREAQKWEAEQAVCIEVTDNDLVFEIPKAPPEIRNQYQQSLETLLGAEDTDLLMSSMNDNINKELNRRTITFSDIHAGDVIEPEFLFGESTRSTLAHPDPTDIDSLFETIGPARAIQDTFNVGIMCYGHFYVDSIAVGEETELFGLAESGSYTPGSSLYERWHHLIGDLPF
ncbi:MAG: hypothetical protein GXY61_14070 [Lentisphaerae bacterium]|jgi:hypothetical protein|nr:hypothetical protein [Lentisphaerota bacterium]